MKLDELTEFEIFRMAVSMAGETLSTDQSMATTLNPGDIMTDRIMACHSAILAAAREVLDKPLQHEH